MTEIAYTAIRREPDADLQFLVESAARQFELVWGECPDRVEVGEETVIAYGKGEGTESAHGETIAQLALFMNARDNGESGTALWETLDRAGQESYLRDAAAIVSAMTHLGWAPSVVQQ